MFEPEKPQWRPFLVLPLLSLAGACAAGVALILLAEWSIRPEAAAGGEVPDKATGAGEAPVPAGMVRVLAMEQEARGLPDKPPDQPIPQKLLIDNAGRRLILILYKAEPGPEVRQAAPPGPAGAPEPSPALEVDRRLILNMAADPPEVIEVWDRDRTFRRTVKDLNTIQEDRDKHEAMMLGHLKAMSAEDQKATLEQNFLRRDGTREVNVVRLEPKRKILGYDCEEVKVFENGRKVIDAWVTKDFPGAKSFFHLYGRLGAFSREVLERVESLEGLPLEAEIVVVTAVPAYPIGARCLSVKTEDIPAASFQVPPDYKERKEDLPAIVPCAGPGCTKMVERKEAKRVLEGNRDFYFCSNICKEKFLQEQDAAKKKKRREQESSAENPAGKKD